MSIALDLGTHALRSLRRDGDHLIARRCRTAYAVLPDHGEQRQLLERAAIAYSVCEGNLILQGDAAAELSRLFQVPCIDLLPNGVVPQADPVARQIIGLLIDSLLPVPAQPHEICCFTQPLHAVRRHGGKTGQLEFFTRLIRLRGYIPQALNAGMAVIFAEMSREAFTGIGASCGASGCEISVAHQGREIVACSVPRGGQWIDQHLARAQQAYCWDAFGNKSLDVDRMAREKESRSLIAPNNPEDQLLADRYGDLVSFALGELSRELATIPQLADLPQPLHVVCGGGVARIPDFCELLRRQFAAMEWPIGIGAIRLATDSPYTIARGCLINAELEAEALRTRGSVA